jgi:hypothetical protein
MHIIRDNCSSGKGGGGRKSGSKPSPKQTLPRVRKRAGSSLPPPTHIVTHAPAPILPHMPVPYTCKRSNPRRGSTTMLGADTPCAHTGAGRPTPQPAAQPNPATPPAAHPHRRTRPGACQLSQAYATHIPALESTPGRHTDAWS